MLTVSDGVHHGTREDLSGALLAERAAAGGHDVVWRGVLPDERDQIAERIAQLCDDERPTSCSRPAAPASRPATSPPRPRARRSSA